MILVRHTDTKNPLLPLHLAPILRLANLKRTDIEADAMKLFVEELKK